MSDQFERLQLPTIPPEPYLPPAIRFERRTFKWDGLVEVTTVQAGAFVFEARRPYFNYQQKAICA